jgi:pilus assembly protein CpaF
MDKQAIFAATVRHYLRPIHPYLDDPAVTEVMINRSDEIYVEKDGEISRVDARFADEQAYEAAVNNILQYTGRSVQDDQPLIDTRLPDGSRVHVIRPPCARHGMAVSIRKFGRSTLDIDWLVELGTLSEVARQYLQIAVRAERNILVAGGTSTGKTSLLNALSVYIPPNERIVVIEDSAELQLQQDHVLSLETRPPDRYERGAVTIRELFRSSLRLRPDRVIIGEVRGGEALDMIQAMTSGQGGSMGTVHANNPSDALNRLETMALMSEVELPLHALRAQIASAIDIIVQMSRYVAGRRMVTQITEVDALGDDDRYRLRDLFTLDTESAHDRQRDMQLSWTGQRSALAGQLRPEEQAMLSEQTRRIFEPTEAPVSRSEGTT